ncbi:prolyl 3-hydroxylase OGFOD1-like [Gigantopelta aegis]|uniref:prolyl 3-hydroxylase OGFOD1-like n=1 Tax=Gigantopelta aegis TaxID=1735272 RepID=UPI001B88A3DB|nr:prolyl 3-hydroxylase OGFOD1-like [Gigantopelta aegis]
MSAKREHPPDKVNSKIKLKKNDNNNIIVQMADVLHTNVKEKLKKAFVQKNTYLEDKCGPVLSQEPFCHITIPQFIQDVHFLKQLEGELSSLSYVEKNNDLYKFHQSCDLKNINLPHIKALNELLQGEFHSWLSDVTGIPLSENVNIFCSKYKYTDVLLCHDDELESRRIAYILYLVPDSWSSADGGTLDLFDTDENGQPRNIVKSICPQRNCLALFEVTEKSFHQVAEVLSRYKTRLSITGWYHGPPISRPPPFIEPAASLTPCVSLEESELYAWINPVYLNPETQVEIRETFESDSEIQLQDFLQSKKYSELLLALRSQNVEWNSRGPAHKRNYCTCDTTNQPTIVQDCVRFFQSDAMFLILSNLTGLKLHELASVSDSDSDQDGESSSARGEDCSTNKSDTPRCGSEVRQWSHGNYTLVHDTDRDISQVALDTVLSIGCKDWQPNYGGFTSYIAKEEDEELLTVYPVENSLALVYRDVSTLRFVKHINHSSVDADCKNIYDIATVYYE